MKDKANRADYLHNTLNNYITISNAKDICERTNAEGIIILRFNDSVIEGIHYGKTLQKDADYSEITDQIIIAWENGDYDQYLEDIRDKN